MRSLITTASGHQRRVKIKDIYTGSKHFANKFTTVYIHAQIRISSLNKFIRIDFFFHRNRNDEQLNVQRIKILLEFNHSRKRIVEAILTANFICNEVVCIAAEPKHSVIRPRILFLRELRQFCLKCFTEFLCCRRCMAAIFK